MKHILTVGDGDLSFSLALSQYYHIHNISVSITASTILKNEQELIDTYSKYIIQHKLKELQERNVSILYSIDATQLHNNHKLCSSSSVQFDLILFNHPHLGYSSIQDEALHAHRHFMLLAHYFFSASRANVLSNKKGSLIHVCLCGEQASTWNVKQAALNAGLVLSSTQSTSEPPLWLFLGDEGQNTATTNLENEQCSKPIVTAPRRYRNGKLGSKNYLGKYGYMHQTTHGIQTKRKGHCMNVANSTHLIFQRGDNNTSSSAAIIENPIINSPLTNQESSGNTNTTNTCFQCKICDTAFPSNNSLQIHYSTPALPDIIQKWKCDITGKTFYSEYALNTFQKQLQLQHSKDSKRKKDDREDFLSGDNNDNLNDKENTTLSIKKICQPPSTTTKTQDSVYIDKQQQITVDMDNVRLRWYARQPQVFQKYMQSKRICDTTIKQGLITLNGVIIYDNSRILHKGDILTITIPCRSKKVEETIISKQDLNQKFGIQILSSQIQAATKNDSIVFVWKPVGLRTCGDFEGTLEYIMTSYLLQQDHPKEEAKNNEYFYESLSRLETGCSGVCPLIKTFKKSKLKKEQPPQLSVITHTFLAIVFGTPTWENGSITLPLIDNENDITRRHWNNKKKKTKIESNSMNSTTSSTNTISTTVTIQLQETITFPNSTSTLTTLKLTTSDSFYKGKLSSLFCYKLRSLGYPVVGDVYCTKENITLLPRIVRNILKSKLLVLCKGVCIDNRLLQQDGDDHKEKEKIEYEMMELPDKKFSLNFWRERCGAT